MKITFRKKYLRVGFRGRWTYDIRRNKKSIGIVMQDSDDRWFWYGEGRNSAAMGDYFSDADSAIADAKAKLT